jgi:hypothetical protein
VGVGIAKGWTLGRPRLALDSNKAASLRVQGNSLRAIAAWLGSSHALLNESLTEPARRELKSRALSGFTSVEINHLFKIRRLNADDHGSVLGA